jgi:hypothetical protein
MRNRFDNRQALNLQIGGPNGTGSVNPSNNVTQPKELPGAKEISNIKAIMEASTVSQGSPSRQLTTIAGRFTQYPTETA